MSGAQDVGEGEAAFVRVPRPHRRSRHRAGGGIGGEPQDQEGIEVADKEGGAQDRCLLAGGGVGEPHLLLQVAETDFDGPPAGIAFQLYLYIQILEA